VGAHHKGVVTVRQQRKAARRHSSSVRTPWWSAAAGKAPKTQGSQGKDEGQLDLKGIQAKAALTVGWETTAAAPDLWIPMMIQRLGLDHWHYGVEGRWRHGLFWKEPRSDVESQKKGAGVVTNDS
jgi:hypothetical protein